MEKLQLPSGLKILFEERKGPSVVVEVMVQVGSDDEAPAQRGISHFIEHMLFEGTKKRPNNQQISNEIEKVGGNFNAYTTNERTCFYVKVLKKHFSLAVDILSDIIQNPLFLQKIIDKEREVILKEIDMVNDEPRYYQWILFQKNIFENHPAKYPTYGEKKTVQKMTRQDLLDYYYQYYIPNNIVVSIVGEVKDWQKEVTRRFTFARQKFTPKKLPFEPTLKCHKLRKEKRKIANTYTVLGFKTVPRTHSDAYVLEVINGILGRGQSGRMFSEIRGKRGLAYDVGTQHIAEVTYGYFAIYASIAKKNQELAKKLILQELNKLQQISPRELQESKDYLEGNYYLENEETQKRADELLFWEQAGNAQLMKEFIPRIKKITLADVKRVAKKYFKYYTLAVIEGN